VATKDKIKQAGSKEAPLPLIIIGVVILVLVLGAGGFYAYNGGWKTSGQQDYDYQHTQLPLIAAKHGDMEAFDAENKLRKEKGQPLLELPKDPKAGVTDPDAFKKMQEQLTKGGVGGTTTAQPGQ